MPTNTDDNKGLVRRFSEACYFGNERVGAFWVTVMRCT